MKAFPCLLFCSVLALSACKEKIENDTTASPENPAAAMPDEAVDATTPPQRGPGPERLAAIQASGRTGMWSSVDETCGKGTRAARSTTLAWNVSDSGASRVVVYVVNEEGVERNFGTGGPIGEKATGPWLRPGITFRLRDRQTKELIDELVIPRAADCPED